MLSDSPPERDVIWTEDGVAGSFRFVQRIWRLVSEWTEDKAAPAAGANAASPEAVALRKSAHRALAAAEDAIRTLRFNVAVARIYELTNAVASAIANPAKDAMLRAAIAEALDILVLMLAPMMPHLAEECWVALGHEGLVAMRPWPAVDQSLLTEDTSRTRYKSTARSALN